MRGVDLVDTDSDTWRPGVKYFDGGCGVERRRVSTECSATSKMEPPQPQLGRDPSRCLLYMPARVLVILNDIPFNKRYFAIKLERCLNFEIYARAFFRSDESQS